MDKAGLSATATHGDKSRGARQTALSNFKSDRIHILIATDIVARASALRGLSYVINFGMPNIPKTYVHRIGRTGRA